MRLDEATYAAIDFESAGSAPGLTDSPVQIAIARMEGFTPLPAEALRSYLRTERPITWSAQQVHGIRASDLQGAPTLQALWPRIQSLLRGRLLVAHGAATERRFLRAFPTHRFGPWIDTLHVARRLHPGLPSYRLGDLVAHFQLEPTIAPLCPGLAWHDALYDATASLVLLRHLIQAAGWGGLPADFLVAEK